MDDELTDWDSANRRKIMKSLAAGATVTLAGCPSAGDDDNSGGDDGDDTGTSDPSDDQELGERVPTQNFIYMTGRPETASYEQMAPLVQENINEGIGLDTSIEPTEFTSHAVSIIQDDRTQDIAFTAVRTGIQEINPNLNLDRFNITNAGAASALNITQYTNCEYSSLAAQAATASGEELDELVKEAITVMSEDYPIVPIVRYDLYNAYRTDAIDASGLGSLGASIFNTEFWVNSTPTTRDNIIAQTSGVVVSTTNYLTTAAADTLNVFGTLVNSPLIEYDQNRELRPSLAEDWMENEDGTQYTFTLADGTFHNGDPITAEDVKWTYEFYNENANLGALLFSGAIESINVVDDRTVEFNLERPDPLWFQTVLTQFGVLNRDYWVENGAEETPEEFDMGGSNFVGSGPFEITSQTVGENITLGPHDGHPAYSPDHGITFTAFDGEEPAYLSFRDGSIDMITQVSLRTVDRTEREMGDEAETTTLEGLFAYYLFTQQSYAPGKFKEYRQALGMCVDRELINENVFFNRSETATYCSYFWENYPHFPGTDEVAHFVDDPSGEPDGARNVLQEAGWGWDDNGDLHYPQDADLEPRWPKGEKPSPDEFPCLDEDGELIVNY